jgi:sensor histidine kinase YesM
MDLILENKTSRFHNFIFSETFPGNIPRHAALWIVRFLFFFFIVWFNEYYKMMDVKAKIIHISDLLFIHIGLEIFFCYSVIYFLIPKFFHKKKYLTFILLVACICIIDLCISFYVIYALFDLERFSDDKVFNIFWGDTLNFLTMGPSCICIFFIIVRTLKAHYFENERKRLILRENGLAEFQLLKSQIHPHFLFNTLNNIYYFILAKPEKAKELIKKLEEILQYMIKECGLPAVPLSSEINLINDYFELEKVRYEDLDVELKITGDCSNKMIAPLLMIPFIENSFKHGTSKMLRDPWIKLFIQADEEMLHFTLTNNKPPETSLSKKSGIGLSNVKKRLGLLYAEKHYLLVEPTVNTFTVNLQVPLGHRQKIIT